MGEPWTLAPHTAAKHQIYRRYLAAWFPILINRFGTVTYAEGFAGHGIYAGGEPGSPIIALRSLLGRRRSLATLERARFVLVDKEPDQVETLSREVGKVLGAAGPIRDYDDGVVQVLVRCGKNEEILPGLLDAVGAWGNPILAIFDTFGGGVPASLLARIASNRSSEVIYTVLPQHFARFHTQRRGDEVFTDPSWRQVSELPAHEKRGYIAEKFATTVRDNFRHVVRFDLGTERGDLLNLWFGTQSKSGLEKFKDATWKADPVAGAGFYDPRDPAQQFLPMQHEPDLAPLRRILHRRLLDSPRRSQAVHQLREFTMLSTVFRAAHVTPALQKMLQQGRIERPDSPVRLGRTIITAVPKNPTLFGDTA